MPSRKNLFRILIFAAIIAALAAARMLTAPAATGGGGKSGQAGKGDPVEKGDQAGKGGQSEKGGKEAKGKEGGGGKATEVSILVLKPEPLARQVLSAGTLLAREEVDLKSEIQGRVTGIHFQEGAKVRKGALLVKLNDADIKAQLEKVQTQVKLSSDKEARQATLLAKDLVSREEYETALQEKNGFLSDRDLLRAQLAKTEILAPFDGVVGLKEISEGSNIAAGTRIAGLFSLDPLKIDFSVPEQYFGQVKAGDSLLISLEGLPKPVKGSVYAIEPKVDPATRMLRIRGYCPNGDGLIAPGASARVRLPLRVIPDAILVPSLAVIPDIKGQQVLLYKGGKAAGAYVNTGYRSEDRIQISGDGVKAGDSLIVSGLIQLRPGSPVRLAEAKGGG